MNIPQEGHMIVRYGTHKIYCDEEVAEIDFLSFLKDLSERGYTGFIQLTGYDEDNLLTREFFAMPERKKQES